jgi:hypothetical protein
MGPAGRGELKGVSGLEGIGSRAAVVGGDVGLD